MNDNIKAKIYNLNNLNKVICNKIIDKINNYKDINYLEMRNNLYEIFVFNISDENNRDLLSEINLEHKKIILIADVFSFALKIIECAEQMPSKCETATFL